MEKIIIIIQFNKSQRYNNNVSARAAIQMNAVRLNTIIASEVILNKTSRRNTVFQKKK